MGCPSWVIIGNNLKFSITTHDPDTGVLTDADAAPAYRIYEDMSTAALLNGTMTLKIDDGGAALTTGLYTAQIACTAGNGFEDGKNYTVYVEATVDSDKGGITFEFTAYDEFKVIEGAYDEQDVLKLLLAYLGGKATGGGTDTVTFRDTGDTKNRVVQTVDENGNRSAVALDVS